MKTETEVYEKLREAEQEARMTNRRYSHKYESHLDVHGLHGAAVLYAL